MEESKSTSKPKCRHSSVGREIPGDPSQVVGISNAEIPNSPGQSVTIFVKSLVVHPVQ